MVGAEIRQNMATDRLNGPDGGDDAGEKGDPDRPSELTLSVEDR